MSISININKEVVSRYRNYGLSLDYLGSVLFILLAIYEEEHDLLDSFDDSNKEKRAMLVYQNLHRKGFLEMDEEETLYNLTEKGVEFVKFLKSYDTQDSSKGKQQLASDTQEESRREEQTTPATSSEVEGDVSQWIEEWIKLFPPEKIEGRYLRTNKYECSDRMRWFMKEYGYVKDVIFKATKAYIQAQEISSQGHIFTRNSSYFIFKGRSKHDRTSDLATWCQRVLDEGFSEKEYSQRDVV